MNENRKNYPQTRGAWAVELSSDDDDKDIEEMQREVEDMLTKITSNKQQKIKETNNDSDTGPIQFSIKVEVEEYQEPSRISVKMCQNTKETIEEQNIPLPLTSETLSNQPSPIILDYMTKNNIPLPKPDPIQPNIIKHYLKTKETLEKPYQCMTPKSFNDFTYDRDMIMMEVRKLSKSSENIADKYMEYLILNIENRPQEDTRTARQMALQKVLRMWSDWYLLAADVRDTPLLYKCKNCDLGWWHLADLEDHMDLTHATCTPQKSSISYSLKTMNNESYIAARKVYGKPQYGSRNQYGSCVMQTKPCWKCGMTAEEKSKIHNKITFTYECICKSSFGTCLAYRLHRDVCKVYNKDVKRHVVYKCHLCFISFYTSEELMTHRKRSHTVRTDVPIAWPNYVCKNCNAPSIDNNWHDCPYAIPHVSCPDCPKKFTTTALLDLHLEIAKKKVKCRLCPFLLEKRCMELMHMMEHTDNYKMLYKCPVCEEDRFFLDPPTYNIHLLAKHPLLDKPARQMPVPVPYLAMFGYSAPPRPTFVYKEDDVKDVEPEEKRQQYTRRPGSMSGAERMRAYRARVRIRKEAVRARLGACVEDYGNIVVEKVVPSPVMTKSDSVFHDTLKESRLSLAKMKMFPAKYANMKTYSKVKVRPKFRIVHSSRETHASTERNINRVSKGDKDVIDTPNITEENIEEYIDNNDEINAIKYYDKDTNINNIDNKTITIKTEKEISNIDNKIETIKAVEQISKYEDKLSATKVEEALDNFEVAENIEIKEELIDSDDNDEGELVIADINDLVDAHMKVEVKEEPEEFYEDDIIMLQAENVNMTELNDSMDNDNFTDYNDTNYDDETNYDDDTNYNDDNGDTDDEDYHEDGVYDKRKYDCKMCNFETQSYHLYKHHKDNFCQLPGRAKKIALEGISEYNCSKCKQSFRTMKAYLKHLHVHKYATLACPDCISVHPQWSKLIMHVHSHISKLYVTVRSIDSAAEFKTFKFQCKKCRTDVTARDFFQHWEHHLELPEKKIEVNYEKYAPESPSLRELIALILGVPFGRGEERRLHWCQLCCKRFNRVNECKRHFIEHLLDDAYTGLVRNRGLKCQICGDLLAKSSTYKSHMRYHASLPVYKCEMCDKCFSDSSNFAKHKKVHNMAVLTCDVCKKKFSLKSQLIKHIETHKIQKPITCPVPGCQKVCYCNSSYRKHCRQAHQKLTRFACPICKERFTALKAKWDHQWLVHGQRKMIADCPVCKQPFRKYTDVKAHLRAEHRELRDLRKMYTLSREERNENVAHLESECSGSDGEVEVV